MTSRTLSSGWRKSTVKNTSPGTTLRLFGLFSIKPTAPTAFGACSSAIASMRSIMRAAPRSAFLRSRIGVAPVCASWPVTVTSYQRMPCTPWTMPIMRPSSSRIGPCSMCSSNIAREFASAGFLFALVADALKFLAECLAVAVGPRIGEFGREDAGKNARGQHRRRVARAFFVGPVHDLDRGVGVVAGLVQRAHGFERAEDAEHAVEFAAGRLRVEMRAHGDRRKVVVLARPPREHVADFVDRNRAAERLASGLEPVAHLPVEIGQREAANAALGRGADTSPSPSAYPKAVARRSAGFAWVKTRPDHEVPRRRIGGKRM